jgi:hypothetical protein
VRNWSLGILGALIIVPLLTFVVGWMIFQVPSISDAGIVQTATYTFAGSPSQSSGPRTATTTTSTATS